MFSYADEKVVQIKQTSRGEPRASIELVLTGSGLDAHYNDVVSMRPSDKCCEVTPSTVEEIVTTNDKSAMYLTVYANLFSGTCTTVP
jgi:hypothetical protein